MTMDLSRVIPRGRYETNVAVVETCACGATFEELYPYAVDGQLVKWREGHRHDMAARLAEIEAEARVKIEIAKIEAEERRGR